jgi:hypothetical protein
MITPHILIFEHSSTCDVCIKAVNSVVCPGMLLVPYHCVYGALFRISASYTH